MQLFGPNCSQRDCPGAPSLEEAQPQENKQVVPITEAMIPREGASSHEYPSLHSRAADRLPSDKPESRFKIQEPAQEMPWMTAKELGDFLTSYPGQLSVALESGDEKAVASLQIELQKKLQKELQEKIKQATSSELLQMLMALPSSALLRMMDKEWLPRYLKKMEKEDQSYFLKKQLIEQHPDYQARFLDTNIGLYLCTRERESWRDDELFQILFVYFSEASSEKVLALRISRCVDLLRMGNSPTLAYQCLSIAIVSKPHLCWIIFDGIENRLPLPPEEYENIFYHLDRSAHTKHPVFQILVAQVQLKLERGENIPLIPIKWCLPNLKSCSKLINHIVLSHWMADKPLVEIINKLLSLAIDRLTIDDIEELAEHVRQSPATDNRFTTIVAITQFFIDRGFQSRQASVGIGEPLIKLIEAFCYKSNSSASLISYTNPMMDFFYQGIEETIDSLNQESISEEACDEHGCVECITRCLSLTLQLHKLAKKYYECFDFDNSGLRKKLSSISSKAVSVVKQSSSLRESTLWMEIDEYKGKELKFFRLPVCMRGAESNFSSFVKIFDLTSDLHRVNIIQYRESQSEPFSEKELVNIASRSGAPVAEYILNHLPLTQSAMAEIGRYHPGILLERIESGQLFQTPESIPFLVQLTIDHKELAEKAFKGEYSPHISPPWRGAIAARWPGLAQPLWSELQSIDFESLTDLEQQQWLIALTYICKVAELTKPILAWALSQRNAGLLVYYCSLHYWPTEDKALLERLRSLPQWKDITPKLASIYGDDFLFKLPSQDQATVRSLAAAYDLELLKKGPIEQDSPFLHSSYHWRTAAESVVKSSDHWCKLSRDEKTFLMLVWPHLGCQFPDRKDHDSMPFERAQHLSQDSASWLSVSPSTVFSICRNFPSIAMDVLFNEKYLPLANKLSEDQLMKIYLANSNTAEKALNKKPLNRQRQVVLLRMQSKIMHLLTCNPQYLRQFSPGQLTEIYCGAKQQANALTLLKLTTENNVRDHGFTAENWVAIGTKHAKVACELIGLQKDRNQGIELNPSHLETLATAHKPIALQLLSSAFHELQAQLSMQQWLTVAKEYPEIFPIMFDRVFVNPGVPRESWLAYQAHPVLWPEILRKVHPGDRSWLISKAGIQSWPAPLPSNKAKYTADFHSCTQGPFLLSQAAVMDQQGCCAGFVLDFIRFAKKKNNPSEYIRKMSQGIDRAWSSMPERVSYLQSYQSNYLSDDMNVTINYQLPEGIARFRNRLWMLLQVKQAVAVSNDASFSEENSHINAIVLKKDSHDLYYFDPNLGIWHWPAFDPVQHWLQVERIIIERLLRNGGKQPTIAIKGVKGLPGKVFPPKLRPNENTKPLSRLPGSDLDPPA